MNAPDRAPGTLVVALRAIQPIDSSAPTHNVTPTMPTNGIQTSKARRPPPSPTTAHVRKLPTTTHPTSPLKPAATPIAAVSTAAAPIITIAAVRRSAFGVRRSALQRNRLHNFEPSTRWVSVRNNDEKVKFTPNIEHRTVFLGLCAARLRLPRPVCKHRFRESHLRQTRCRHAVAGRPVVPRAGNHNR